MKHRILISALAVGLCLGLTGLSTPGALAFSDVADSTVSEAVEVLAGLDVVSGYSDGGYHPNDALTRAQFCKLAILMEGHGSQVTNSAYRTLFSDVPGSNWAAPYINLAYEEGLVAGYGDGTFGPDDAVTTGQAVTIALHLLGYTNEEIGPFWPEDYMEKGAALGLLDGISKTADQTLNRGEAALLLYHMLDQTTSTGQEYLDQLCASKLEGVVVLDNAAEAEDGTLNTLEVYTAQGLSYYEQSNVVPEALVGRKGTVLLDQAGKVTGFVPDETVSRQIQLSEVEADGITDASGYTYSVSSGSAVLLDGNVSTYGTCWYELEGRASVTLYYSASGSVELVVATDAVAYEGVTLTGYYENASPNTTSPQSITLLGIDLDVAEDTQTGLSSLAVGDRITVTLNGAGEVISACPASQKQVEQYGVLENGSVRLTCGLTAQGEISSGSAKVGDLVKVSSSGIGELSVSAVSGGSSYQLKVPQRTLGTIPLSDDLVLYERVGASPVTEIEWDDLLVDTVPAASIDFYATNDSGEVCLLLLDDVTGNAYTYGVLTSGEVNSGESGMSYTNLTVSVENGDGTSQAYITGTSVKNDTVGGVAATSEGKTAGIVVLESAEGIARSAFDGTEAVVVDGIRVPVSDEVQVYNANTQRWTTLSEAKAYADTFTVYYSGTLGEDAVVRVVVTQS